MSVTCAVRLTRVLGLSTTLLCALLASGCTTLKAVQEVGKQAAEGNVLTAAYTATIGVAVAAIVGASSVTRTEASAKRRTSMPTRRSSPSAALATRMVPSTAP